jgi:hypothetical protein
VRTGRLTQALHAIRGSLTAGDLATEAIRVATMELATLEALVRLMEASGARTQGSYRRQVVAAATGAQRKELELLAERIDELQRRIVTRWGT